MIETTGPMPMREIVMDTETTGLDPMDGHRVVEIGAVELINHLPTGVTFHKYLNPQRDMPIEAFNVHGLSAEFLSDKPLFADVAEEFLAFVGDAAVIIHNASFDRKFLNAEMQAVKCELIPPEQVVDSLAIARRKFPMGPNSLDALCKRFGIDNSRREKHGALLDSELLAEVYLELIGGRQTTFALASEGPKTEQRTIEASQAKIRPQSLPSRLTDEERTAHAELVADLGNEALWSRMN
jgi:DNA polymerase-3 subunit epsilon